MDIVVAIMRQHRRIQWIEEAIDGNPRLRPTLMVELIDAVMLHASTIDAVLPSVTDTSALRDLRAHRLHHDRATAALVRIATCRPASFEAEFASLRGLLRIHVQHEMVVVQRLRAMSAERLEVLGDTLASFDIAADRAS